MVRRHFFCRPAVVVSVGVLLYSVRAPAADAQLAQLIYSQPPSHGGGFLADTEADDGGFPTGGQFIGDKFTLTQPRDVRRLRFFGLYGSQTGGIDPDPPITETMRVEIWSDAGGLPGTLLFQESYFNPSRV